MLTVPISEFRANMPAYVKKMKRGTKIAVTSHEKVLFIATTPTKEQEQARERLKALLKTSWIGDVVSPPSEQWNILKEDFDPNDPFDLG
ncbi:MAG TPA: type II toxin-antitoxin system prevent-host-death family antitoxin [Candidatus Kapabacteria bacterium]|nr:type II toxin-antitoxin system prevent-host-death family antitoxin [Candidatus Kapabacteria bacterium]